MVEKALRYNQGKPKWSLVHFQSLEPLVRVLEYGAHKYSIFCNELGDEFKGSEIAPEQVKMWNLKIQSSGVENWKKGLDQKEILDSLTRHLFALISGEENDPESGLPHMGHIMCNALFYQYHKNKENDLGRN